MSLRSVLLVLSAAAFALALGFGAYRVHRIERRELEHVTRARTLRDLAHRPEATRISARLTSLPLRRGTRAVFELCAREGLSHARFRDALDFAVLDLGRKTLLLRVPLSSAHLAHVRRNSDGGCLMLGQGVLEHDSTYSIEAVWRDAPPSAAVLDTPLFVRVLAKPDLEPLDRASFVALGLAVFASLLLLLAPATHSPAMHDATASASHRVWIGVGAGLAALFFATLLPLFGATLTLVKGTLLLALQLGLAFGLARTLGAREVRARLGLLAPEHRAVAFASAALAWPLLVVAARSALRLVPATGEAPIETFVAWPSGMLAAALLGAALPIGEEIFFRGYVYGALVRFGRGAAATLSLLAFVLLHAEQAWGQWGALVAIACAGAVFTGLRIVTGSTLVPALTHVAYNVALSASSIFHD